MKEKWLATIFYFLVANFTIPTTASAGKIERAFESLKQYNYFEAKQLFEKSLDKYPVISGFGLSVIHLRNDNPFHNLDAAYTNVNSAIKFFNQSGKQEQAKLTHYNISEDSLIKVKAAIELQAFKHARQADNISSLKHFVDFYPSAIYVDAATRSMDSLAFIIALKENSSEGYQKFMNENPESHLFYEAKTRYDRTLYEESVYDGSESSYARFSEAYPKSVYSREAMRMLYQLATKNSNDPEVYHNFIKNYPQNIYIEDAWQRIFELNNISFDETSITQFIEKYPDYPYVDKLQEELKLTRITLLPFKEGEGFGLINDQGEIVVEPVYSFIGKFHEGIAIVAKNGKMGYMAKSGYEVIPPFYDDAENFNSGLAIVGENGKYGVINRSGKMVVPLMYQEISDFSGNLAVAFDGNLYGYINRNGMVIIPFQFEDASEFRNNAAICQLNDQYGMINTLGDSIIPFIYEGMEWHSDDVVKISKEDQYGLMRKDGTWLTEVGFDEIGQFSQNMAVVIKNDRIGFIDASGKLAIPLKYENWKDGLMEAGFKNDYAIVKNKNKFGVINSQGKILLPFQFDDLHRTGDSLVAFRKQSKWGITEIPSGRILIQPVFTEIYDLKDGYAVVVINKKYGAINNKGNLIVPADYELLQGVGNGLFLFKSSEKFGCIDWAQNIVVTPEYEVANESAEGYVEFSTATQRCWLEIKTKRVFQKQ